MLNSLIKISGKKLLLPLYHLVSDSNIPHVNRLYGIKTIKEFESDIEFILKYFNPVGVNDVIDSIKNNKTLKSNSVLFTFDDGLREVYEIIVPLLLQKGIPAVFFVNDDFVDNKNLFYRYKVSLLLNEFKKNTSSIEVASKILKVNKAVTRVEKEILNIDYLNKGVLDQIASGIGYSFTDYLLNKRPYLSKNQLTSMIRKGFIIGAHSADHPEYFRIPFNEQIKQTESSIIWLKDNFNQDINTFAFPFTDYGVSKKFFDIIFSNKELKMDLTFGCAGIKDDYHKQHLQRLPMEAGYTNGNSVITKEYLKYLLKKLILKNRIERI